MADNKESLWNFDDKVSNILSELKANFLTSMFGWDLETAYFNVRLLWVESDAKLDRIKKMYPEKDEGEGENKLTAKSYHEADYAAYKLQNLEIHRKYWLEGKYDKGLYYKELEDFYMLVCLFMKYNGLYFREGHDASRAALRR